MGLKIYEETIDSEIKVWVGGNTDRLIRLVRIITNNLKIQNYTLEIVEWFKPLFYLELRQDWFKYPNNSRLSLSYNTRTGTIMNETIGDNKSEQFHGCVRKGMTKLLNIIKKELNTEFDIPIDTRYKRREKW